MKKLNVAIIGQGRSGKDIHGRFMVSENNQWYNVKYVVDKDEFRRSVALKMYEGCEVFASYKELFDKKDIDLIVNCTYSNEHYPVTRDCLEHGYNVLCEKPFGKDRFECDTVTKIAKDKGLVLAVFQQTFFAPYYQKVLEIINSGILGKVYQASIRFSSHNRRWDWQTLQKKMGGNAYNTGPHPFGIALGLLDFDPDWRIAFSSLATTDMSSGDSDDYCKVIMTAPGKPVIDVEINNTDFYSSYTIKLQAERGSLKATPSKIEYKYFTNEENPKKDVIEASLADENGNPMYCGEKLVTHEESVELTGTAFDVGTRDLYKNVYDAITEGKALYVTPENASDIINVIETIHAENPLEVKYY